MSTRDPGSAGGWEPHEEQGKNGSPDPGPDIPSPEQMPLGEAEPTPPPPPPASGYPAPPSAYPPPLTSLDQGVESYPDYGPRPPELVSSYSVPGALKYGLKKFGENVGAWIGALIILYVGAFLIYQVLIAATAGMLTVDTDPVTGAIDSDDIVAAFLSTLLISLPLYVVNTTVLAQTVRGSLATADQGRISVGTFFQASRLGTVILAAIIVSVITGVGSTLLLSIGFTSTSEVLVLMVVLLAFLWQFVVVFLVQFYPYFVLGEGQGAWPAVRSSIQFVGQNVGKLLLLLILSGVLVFIGAMLCLVGLLVAVPVVVIAQAYTFRVLRDEPVVP